MGGTILEFFKAGDREDLREPLFDLGNRKSAPFNGRENLLLDRGEEELGIGVIKEDADPGGDIGEVMVLAHVFAVHGHPAGFLPPVFMLENAGCGQAEGGLA